MNEQVELKLELSQDAATFLEASPLLSRSATKADQRAIYFDTPAQTLLRHLDRLDGEARHIIRKDAKRLRYDAEFVGLL